MKLSKIVLMILAVIISLNITNPVVSAKPKELSVAAKSIRSAGSLKAGMVKWFNEEKCFGFIQPGDQSEDLFVHCKSVQETGSKILKPNTIVYFNTISVPKGKEAVDVRRRGEF